MLLYIHKQGKQIRKGNEMPNTYTFEGNECWIMDRECCNCESCGDRVVIFIPRTVETIKVLRSELVEA